MECASFPADATLEELGGGATAWISPRFRFGTDALLLARFALECAPRAVSAVELGTGCGVIPILWARQNPDLRIFAAEIQPEGCALARRSAEDNELTHRLTVWQGNLKELKQIHLPAQRPTELVACNPPYFATESGASALGSARRTARAEECCTVADVAQAAARLLFHGGWFCMIHRTERLCDVLEAMRRAGIEPKRLQFVQTAPGRAPKLFLVGGRRGGNPGLELLPPREVGV